MSQVILNIENLFVQIQQRKLFNNLSMSLYQGEVLGIVGNSGSGKTYLLNVLAGLSRFQQGGISFNFLNDSFLITPETDLNDYALSEICGLTFQNATAALNPYVTIRAQVQMLPGFCDLYLERMENLLSELGFVDSEYILSSYVHQLSGGMAQRVMLALVLARNTPLLLLDEITSGLDFLAARKANSVIRSQLKEQSESAAVLVSHDLDYVEHFCDRVLELKNGRLESWQAAHKSFTQGYKTQDIDVKDRLIDLKNTKIEYKRDKYSVLLCQEKLEIYAGEIVGLVGPSGCGKTALLRAICGVIKPISGSIKIFGQTWDDVGQSIKRDMRARLWYLHQSAYTSLNSAMTVRQFALSRLSEYGGLVDHNLILKYLQLFGLQQRCSSKISYLSGGERKRLGLMCALFSQAQLLLLDEPLVGLEETFYPLLEAELKRGLKRTRDRSIIIVTHNLPFLQAIDARIITVGD